MALICSAATSQFRGVRMRIRPSRVATIFLVCMLGRSWSFAQQRDQLTVDWLYSEEGRSVTALPLASWLDDGTAVIYDSRRPEAERTFERLDPADGSRRLFFKADAILAQFRSHLGSAAPTAIPWPTAIDTAGHQAIYIFVADSFLLDLQTASVRQAKTTSAEEKATAFSTDNKIIAFVRSNNLYVYDIPTGKERSLTSDDSDNVLNGTLSWVYWEEIFG